MEIMQDTDYLKKFKVKEGVLEGGDILDGISGYFAKYEVPIGLLNKLLALSEYKLNFIMDDSGSMSSSSDVTYSEVTDYIKQRYGESQPDPRKRVTRWEEAEDRLHVIFDMLAYIPTNTISINFLNRGDKLVLERKGETPAQFSTRVHGELNNLFRKGPNGGTPLFKKLTHEFKQSHGSTMHYLFTDGEPSDSSTEQVSQLVANRKNARANPITFISCTDDTNQAEWMKEVDEAADFCAEIDDFYSEQQEVIKKQGKTFPYTRGFWLLCQLCAAINPDDLDALDEKAPFTKMTLDNLLGRKSTIEEYRFYFQNHPCVSQYSKYQPQFEREDITANDILKPKSSVSFFDRFRSTPKQPPAYDSSQPGFSPHR